MKTWGRAVVLLTLAVLLAVVLKQHGGNVLITAPPWRVELSLTLAVLLLAALFLLLHGLLRALRWLAQGPQRMRQWRGQRAQRRDRASLEQGWIGVLEGRNQQAEQQLCRLLSRTRSPDTKVLAALALARSQHDDGRHTQRDDTLVQARAAAAGQTRLQEAVAVVHAELLLDQSQPPTQPAQALQLLQPVVQTRGAANPKALNATLLLLQAHWQLAHYPKVLELTRLLQRKGAIKPAQARVYLEKAITEQLAGLSNKDAAAFKTGFKTLWMDLKREEKLWPAVALQAARLHAEQHGTDQTDDNTAGKILEAALAHTLDAQLLDAYSHCAPAAVAQRVAKAEDWLKTSPDHVALLMALGTLCLRGQLWGAAERYLQRSLTLAGSIQPQAARIHALLGSLYDNLGRSGQAMQHWRLAAGVDSASASPMRQTVLPAADTRSDPGSMDTVANPGRTTQTALPSVPLAASAADCVLADDPHNAQNEHQAAFAANTAANHTPFAHDAEEDLYFDSAVIPGVDLSQTSDHATHLHSAAADRQNTAAHPG